jgi:hypothetical protein
MKQVRAYRYRIRPSGEQQKILEQTFGCVRFVYNKLLEEKLEHHKLTGTMLRNTPAHLKHAFVWLKEVDSLSGLKVPCCVFPKQDGYGWSCIDRSPQTTPSNP